MDSPLCVWIVMIKLINSIKSDNINIYSRRHGPYGKILSTVVLCSSMDRHWHSWNMMIWGNYTTQGNRFPVVIQCAVSSSALCLRHAEIQWYKVMTVARGSWVGQTSLWVLTYMMTWQAKVRDSTPRTCTFFHLKVTCITLVMPPPAHLPQHLLILSRAPTS